MIYNIVSKPSVEKVFPDSRWVENTNELTNAIGIKNTIKRTVTTKPKLKYFPRKSKPLLPPLTWYVA